MTASIDTHHLARMLQAARKDGLRDETLQLLCLLDHHGSRRMTDLADAMGVSTAAMTSMVDSLERRSYVRRVPHPTDRRVILIEAMGLGRHALELILTA